MPAESIAVVANDTVGLTIRLPISKVSSLLDAGRWRMSKRKSTSIWSNLQYCSMMLGTNSCQTTLELLHSEPQLHMLHQQVNFWSKKMVRTHYYCT